MQVQLWGLQTTNVSTLPTITDAVVIDLESKTVVTPISHSKGDVVTCMERSTSYCLLMHDFVLQGLDMLNQMVYARPCPIMKLHKADKQFIRRRPLRKPLVDSSHFLKSDAG
jgi:hypothetical protein